MIKHIVMWNVKGATPEEKQIVAEGIKLKFESLVGTVPGLLSLEIGVDCSRVSYACDIVLYSEFRDHDSLKAYADHPAHLKIRDELKDLRTARFQVDYAPA